ncbi:MAG: hypothetical protein M0R32_09365 [Candidatus Cloacimonetes bacterium]|jgi:hypothetical protein|nr:hypothetical protein [Candidatus Cloacimonadota bacterium]
MESYERQQARKLVKFWEDQLVDYKDYKKRTPGAIGKYGWRVRMNELKNSIDMTKNCFQPMGQYDLCNSRLKLPLAYEGCHFKPFLKN